MIGAQSQSVKTLPFGDSVTIKASIISEDPKRQKWVFENGVRIEMGVTTVTADHLEVDLSNQTGSARGHVRVYDPAGTVDADNLELRWMLNGQHAHAEHAFLRVGSSRLKAGSADLGPDLWVFHDVELTTSRAQPAWYEVHSRTLTIKPGKTGKIEKPSLYILGTKILTFPTRNFNLDRRSEGLTIPGFNYNHQYGLGVSWGGGFLLDHRTDLAFALGIFPTARPGYGATITRSLLQDSESSRILTPFSDLGERFSYGYLENISISSPESEEAILKSPQKSIAVDSVWNQSLSDRGTSAPFSKAAELVYEVGGGAGSIGYVSQLRTQMIREFGQAYQERAILVGDIGLPPVAILPHLRTISRIDSDLFFGRQQYGWARGFLGLAFSPVPQLRLSTGGYFSGAAGNAQYAIDPLYSKTGYSVRADLNLGPTKFSYLQKFDGHLGWFDKEYVFSQVVGAFEPFILYRKNPSDYQLGLRLRLDDLTDLFNKRKFVRAPLEPHPLSPASTGTP